MQTVLVGYLDVPQFGPLRPRSLRELRYSPKGTEKNFVMLLADTISCLNDSPEIIPRTR